MTPQLNLDFHGTSVRLTAEDARTLDELRRDFAAFASNESPAAPRVRLELCARACPPPAGPWRWSWRDYSLRPTSDGRLIRYDDGSWVRYDYKTRTGIIHATSRERLRELAYLAVLSRSGEELDRRGLHRVHALGFTAPGGAGLVLLPSGGGKSSLALEILRRNSLALLSDECPLVSVDGRIHPFPLRLALRAGTDVSGLPIDSLRPFRRLGYEEKMLFDPTTFGGSPGTAAPLRWLFVGSPSEGEARLEPLSRTGAMNALIESMVVGVGLTQMAEYMARADSVLVRIAFSRLRAAFSMMRRARLVRIHLGSKGAAAAARVLETALRTA